ncbi:L-gulono-1,4-lactone dehydrogenase-like isoform X3 [Branchiostoma floridae x Branchiostoma japonicum]
MTSDSGRVIMIHVNSCTQTGDPGVNTWSDQFLPPPRQPGELCNTPDRPILRMGNASGSSRRRVFRNYDGTEEVEPLVAYFTPVRGRMMKDPLPGMKLDTSFKNRGKDGLDPTWQIAAVVHHASLHNLRVRAVGVGYSWSKMTSTRDILIDMSGLTRVITKKPQKYFEKYHLVEVQAGKVVREFVREIDIKFKLALPGMDNFMGQTVGGAVCTSAHGSGFNLQSISNSVVSLHMIIAGGIQVTVREPTATETDMPLEHVRALVARAQFGDGPLEIISKQAFRAAQVGLGCLGIIYSVIFKCVPLFEIMEQRRLTTFTWPASGDSLDFRIPRNFDSNYIGSNEFFSFFVNPFPKKCCSREGWLGPGVEHVRVVYVRGRKATENDYLSRPPCRDACACCCCEGCRGCTACEGCKTDVCASCYSSYVMREPSSVPGWIDNCMKMSIHKGHYVNTWYKVLQYNKGTAHVASSEWSVALEDLEAALGDVIAMAVDYGRKHNYFNLMPLSCRLTKSDEAYLSLANKYRPDGSECERYAHIELPYFPGSYGVEEFHRALEDMLYERYQARAHWAKNRWFDARRVHDLYPALEHWKEVYTVFNSDHTFDNQFTARCGFEDSHEVMANFPERSGHMTWRRKVGGYVIYKTDGSPAITRQPSRISRQSSRSSRSSRHGSQSRRPNMKTFQ